MMKKIKTIFVVGPTASGKTDLSIKLAKHFGGEIVSADSMQIYKGIHIASAAPDEAEKSGVPHHLFEFLDIESEFSVAEYVKMARQKICEISGKGKLPIVVGGTGLYISSLCDNTEYLEEKTDIKLRESLEQEFDLIGGEAMLERLSQIDPDSASRLHINDRRRIIRAFEVYTLTGKTITHQNEVSHNGEELIDPLIIGINYSDRQKLYDRINLRVDKMLRGGLLDEAKANFALANNKGAFQAIGHKEFYPYFEGEITLEEATESLKQQTRRYAKRQLTWFRRDQRVNWFYPDCDQDICDQSIKLTEEFLKEEKA